MAGRIILFKGTARWTLTLATACKTSRKLRRALEALNLNNTSTLGLSSAPRRHTQTKGNCGSSGAAETRGNSLRKPHHPSHLHTLLRLCPHVGSMFGNDILPYSMHDMGVRSAQAWPGAPRNSHTPSSQLPSTGPSTSAAFCPSEIGARQKYSFAIAVAMAAMTMPPASRAQLRKIAGICSIANPRRNNRGHGHCS